MYFNFPDQRITYAEKIKNDNEWGRRMMDYLGLFHNSHTDEYERMLSNYRLYNNIIDQKDFERDCNVMGIDVGQFKEEILPYNKTPNKINALVADEMKRPFKWMAHLTDPDSIKQKENQKSKMLQDWLEVHIEEIVAEFKAKQLPADASQEEQEAMQLEMQALEAKKNQLVPPEQISKWHPKYRDRREIVSNKLLKYWSNLLKFQEKRADSFKHALLSAKEVLWVGVEAGQLTIKVLNSLNVFHHKAVDEKYIQDGLFAGYRSYAPIPDILSKYSDRMTKEQIDKLKSWNGYGPSSGAHIKDGGHHMQYNFSDDGYMQTYNTLDPNTEYGQYDRRHTSEIMVLHAEWVSQRKIGFLTFLNEFGDEEVKMVDETFKPPVGAIKSIEKKGNTEKPIWTFNLIEGADEEGNPLTKEYTYEEGWVPQVWEGIRIGSDIYIDIGPKKYSYFSIYTPYVHKLGYHGIEYSNMNAPAISVMDRMKPYQHLFFACMHKLRKLIAHDKGRVFHLDETMIPDSLGLEKTLYYLDELNLDIYNPLKSKELPGGFNNSKITGSTDRSNMQHILNYVQLLNYIDMQISEASGVNKGREGMSMGNQAVTTAQQDLVQSSLVTEIYFTAHNSLWESILNSLLSIGIKFYKDNNQRMLQYVLDDLSVETINLEEEDLENCDLGVFVTDSLKENRVFETLQQISQALIQNDSAAMSHIIGVLEADSLSELKRDIKVFEEQKASQAQQEREAQMQLQKDAQEYARETMLMKEQAVTDREIRKAEIMVFSRQDDLDSDDDGTIDPLQIETLKQKVKDSDRKFDLEERKLKQKDKEIEIKDKIANKLSHKSK